MYWIHSRNIHTFTYQKILLHALLLPVSKIVENLQCILKAIMKRTRLKYEFINYRCEENKRAYNAQRNRFASLVRKAKIDYFNNLDLKNVTGNKNFWKTMKPFFTDKGMNEDKIILVHTMKSYQKSEQMFESLNNFFCWCYNELEYSSAWRPNY